VYKAAVQTEQSIAYLKERVTSEKPFLLVQGYYPPHDPFSAPIEFYAPYRGKGIPFAGYYAAVSALDHYLGRLVDTLKQTRLDRRVILIFCSDHGETFLYRGGTDHKATCHEDSIRIPLVFWAPGRIPSGITVEGAAGLEDLMPTILDYASVPLPAHLQGQSLRRLLEQPKEQGRRIYYIENTTDHRDQEALATMFSQCYSGRAHPDPLRVEQRAVWTPGWKLVLDANDKHLLFDLTVDPEEEYNLYGAPRPDPQNQYSHFPDQSQNVVRLATLLRNEAVRLHDPLGITLADRVLVGHPGVVG
jgi:choline-sulfatase